MNPEPDDRPGDISTDTVAAALLRLHRGAPVVPLDAGRVRHAVRRRRMMIAGPVAVVLAVMAILAGVLLSRPGDQVAAPPVSACVALQAGAPPVWARAGFTGRSYPPHATSAGGNLVAIVWGELSAPPAEDHSNKILWVYRGGAPGDMHVTAHLEGSDRVVTKEIPVGPSIVDMPAAGCWRMDLTIGGSIHDEINLRWTRP